MIYELWYCQWTTLNKSYNIFSVFTDWKERYAHGRDSLVQGHVIIHEHGQLLSLGNFDSETGNFCEDRRR